MKQSIVVEKAGGLTFRLFRQSQFHEWRWHALARNGKRVATSGESFASKRNAERALRAFLARLTGE